MKELRFTTSKGDFLVCDAINGANIHTGISLKHITEEQTSEIVGSIEELHSLLKSKGIHLFENPTDFPECIDGYPGAYLDAIQEDIHLSEQKTFYNPYIFKITQ